MTARFELDGHPFVALNGGPVPFEFNEAVSFVIDCADQAEVDRYWETLTDGGAPVACGWLKDRFGLRWQVVPIELHTLLADPDPGRAQRVTEAMLQMTKLDVAARRAAADGAWTTSGAAGSSWAPSELDRPIGGASGRRRARASTPIRPRPASLQATRQATRHLRCHRSAPATTSCRTPPSCGSRVKPGQQLPIGRPRTPRSETGLRSRVLRRALRPASTVRTAPSAPFGEVPAPLH